MTGMATVPLSLWAVLSESKRIINAHSRHFLALSVIFLLPLSFSVIVSPTLFTLFSRSLSPNSSHIHVLLRTTTSHHHHHHHINPSPSLSTLLFPLLFSLLLLILSLSALSSITRSTLHGFFGRPVKLPSALFSILSSFLPLLSTTLLSHLILFSISLIFSLPLFFLLLHSPPTSTLSYTLSLLILISLLLLLFYLRLSWTLSSVIVIAESSWGLHPLRRSAHLMRRMKPLGASSLCFFALLEGLLLWSSSVLVMGSDGNGASGGVWWKDWACVVQIVLTSTMLMLLMLYNAAANAVLYMYCKAVQGELAVEIAEEFATEYVSLPFDEGKVPHLVSVAHV